MSYTADTWPADRWPNFDFAEMACQETGECAMDKATMDRLQLLRSHLGFPLTITSGYRSPHHRTRVGNVWSFISPNWSIGFRVP